MDIKNVKIGTKVKLLGKHGFGSNYNNIEDWFEDKKGWDDVQQIKKQGYGIVTNINKNGDIWVADDINNDDWCFLPLDLEPYDEEFFEESQENKTPKEWLLTPLAIFTLAIGEKYITLGNGTSYIISNGKLWSSNLDEAYNEDLRDVCDCDINDIIKITHEGEVVWERKEEIKKMTLKEIEKELGYKIEIVNE